MMQNIIRKHKNNEIFIKDYTENVSRYFRDFNEKIITQKSFDFIDFRFRF